MVKCVACKQPSDDQQPYYCLQCFIPIPTYKDGKYIGDEVAYCPECEQIMQDHNKCSNCDYIANLPNPPQPKELSDAMKIRERNRTKLAQDVLSDNRMTEQVIELLGISHIPRSQQGVALTALAKEKMNFLSADYNFTEAHTLVDMGYAIAVDTGEEWAEQVTSMRLASVYIRRGLPQQAALILTETYLHAPNKTTIEQFRKLEILAHLALAHRLAGNSDLADQAADQAHEELLTLYQQMEKEIAKLVQNPEIKSQYMGIDEEGSNFPRVDYVFTIAVILTEETIARGGTQDQPIDDLVLDRMLELNNLINLLAEITPKDDVGYYASHLRDFMRLANGLLWYGDLLLPNTGTKRRYFIEEFYERIVQWKDLIPTNFWLPLRPARFLEILLRATEWSDKIDGDKLMSELIEQSADQHKPSWDYVLADTYSNVGKLDKAVEHLQNILQERKDYIKYADDELKTLAQQLYNSIQLESVGILVGVSDQGSEWLELPVNIQLEDPSSPIEPESYLKEEFKKPVLRMSFDTPPQGQTIGVFGDKLLEIYDAHPSIIRVGNRAYDSDKWHTPTAEKHIEGQRMDIVVLRTELEDQTLTILFEGRPQGIKEEENRTILEPSPLLILRGIIHKGEINTEDLVNILISLTAEHEMTAQTTELFTLKKT